MTVLFCPYQNFRVCFFFSLCGLYFVERNILFNIGCAERVRKRRVLVRRKGRGVRGYLSSAFFFVLLGRWCPLLLCPPLTGKGNPSRAMARKSVRTPLEPRKRSPALVLQMGLAAGFGLGDACLTGCMFGLGETEST